MSESEGRRVKRPVYIRASSVRFLNENELSIIEQVERFQDVVNEKKRYSCLQ